MKHVVIIGVRVIKRVPPTPPPPYPKLNQTAIVFFPDSALT